VEGCGRVVFFHAEHASNQPHGLRREEDNVAQDQAREVQDHLGRRSCWTSQRRTALSQPPHHGAARTPGVPHEGLSSLEGWSFQRSVRCRVALLAIGKGWSTQNAGMQAKNPGEHSRPHRNRRAHKECGPWHTCPDTSSHALTVTLYLD